VRAVRLLDFGCLLTSGLNQGVNWQVCVQTVAHRGAWVRSAMGRDEEWRELQVE